jgi:hypothetical protein
MQTTGWLQIACRCQFYLTYYSEFVENLPSDARSQQSLSDSSSVHISPIYSPLVPPHAYTAQSHISDTHAKFPT